MDGQLNENLLVGLVAAALVPLLILRIVRALKTGQVPLYRTQLHRDDDKAKFYAIMAVNGLALVIISAIAADLLLGLNLRNVE